MNFNRAQLTALLLAQLTTLHAGNVKAFLETHCYDCHDADVEVDLLQVFDSLLTKLKASKEGTGEALLDCTMTLLTSNMRDGNSHKCWDAPAILAGGGFKHGQHLAFNKPWLEALAAPAHSTPITTKRPVMGINQAPMSNLFVSIIQRAGIETDHFGTSTGTLTGLETV